MAYLDARVTRMALAAGSVAGMIDLVALPLWVSTLISGFGYRPALAGAMPTAFLAGAVLASVALASRFHGLNGRRLAPVAYAAAAVALLAISAHPGPVEVLLLHVLAGLAVGTGASFVTGTMGRTAAPHRMFAMAGLALGLFSLVFMGAVPPLLAHSGPGAFFVVLAGIMALAAVILALFLPARTEADAAAGDLRRLPGPARLAIAGVAGMALVQALVYSFVIEIGRAGGVSEARIQLLLLALGVVNLVPPVLAALLERRLDPMGVARTGPLVQAVLTVLMVFGSGLPVFAVGMLLFPSVIVFCHTFVFGFLAGQDPSGRAVAATPAMLMTGSAIAPLLGGAVVELAGFPALAALAVLIALAASAAFARAGRSAAGRAARLAAG